MSSTQRTRTLQLLVELVRRDFRSRFVGSALGLLWAIIQPVSFVVLYWFVFTVMITQGPRGSGESYSLFLISGLVPWLGFQEGIVRGATSIVDNGAMVRRLTFQSEVLAVVPNVSAMILELVGLGCFVGYIAVRGMSIRGLWLLPVALAFQFALQVGITWLLATIHVFFRDVVQVLSFALTFWFFLSPILYSVKGPYARYFAWNPMTPLLGLFRSALLGDPLPGLVSFVYLLAATGVLFAGGLFVFRRVQPSIADLL